MNKNLWESSEFYSKRYQNFSTMIIFPVFFLLAFSMVFILIAKKEINVEASAEITPAIVIEKIQSSSNNDIIENNLEENKSVKSGDTILIYDHEQEEIQLNALKKKEETVLQQLEQIQFLKEGVESGIQNSYTDDLFGYEQELINYFSKVENLIQGINKENQEIDNQNATIEVTKKAFDDAITETNNKLEAYKDLKNAILENKSLPDNHYLANIQSSYLSQYSEQLEQKDNLKNQYLSEVENNIQQLENSVMSLTIQKAEVGGSIPKTTSLESQKAALKAETLANINREITTLNTTKSELETNISLESQNLSQTVLKVQNKGILHVNEDIIGMQNIPLGTTIAELYPELEKEAKVNLVFNVSTAEIASLCEGQEVRMNILEKDLEPVSIKGVIYKIASIPDRTEFGNFYEITAEVILSENQATNVRYGLEGKVTITTGKKTFFNYYKDKLLNNKF